MKEEFTFYVGVDWGVEFHQACILDAHGEKICQRRIEHSGPGMLEFCDFLQALTNGEASALAVAIEVPRGPIVEALLEHNYAVFSINPKQLDRFRDRHTVAGAKDDRRDALVAADSLRTDQHCFRRVRPEHPDVIRLRELSRTEETLGIDLRRCVNQLSQLLLRYFPQLLRLCSTPDEPWLWALLELAPTPQQAAKLTEKRLKQLLAKYRIRRWTAEKVGEILTAPPLPLAAGSAEAISEHALLLLPQLRLLHLQRKQVADRTQQLLDQMATSTKDFPMSQEHRDIPVLLSLPGVGRIITATMLAEGSHILSLRDYHALRAHAGIAPVTKQSGKSRQVLMRYRCNQRLRNAFYHWARTSIQHDPRSKHHYARLRQVGHDHGRALRGVADRLLAMLIAMLKSGQTYDPNRRSTANLAAA